MPTKPKPPGSSSREPVFPGPGPHAYYKSSSENDKKNRQQYRGQPVFPGPGPHAYYRKPPASKGSNPNDQKQRLAQTDALKRVAKKYISRGPK